MKFVAETIEHGTSFYVVQKRSEGEICALYEMHGFKLEGVKIQ